MTVAKYPSSGGSSTGTAGGDLGGTFPNPTVAAITETSGPTTLTIGTITDGQYLKRVGTTLVSGSPAGAGTVTSVTATDSTVTVAGTAADPTVGVATGGITNTQVNASAAISLSKLAAVTASKVLVSDGSGVVSPSSVTTTTLGYLDATSSIQTQLNTKASTTYVDSAVEGLSWKSAVRAASTANVSISSAPSSIDGVTLNASDRILLKNQTAPAENGIYTFAAASSALTRSLDANTWNELVGAVCYVEEGSTNAGGKYNTTIVLGGTLNTTAVTWTTFSAPTAITGSGTTNYVTYWTGTNALGAEATLSNTRGGLGTDGSGFTGVVKASSGTFSASTLVNADVSGSAAIAYSKLNLTGAILNADLAGSIAYGKLSLTGAILNADLAGSIAYSKLSLTGAILNADLAGSIADSKLSTISTGGKVSGTAITSGDISTSGQFTSSHASGITASAGPVTSGNASNAGSLKMYDASNHLLTINPGAMSGANTYTWPTSTGTNNYVLSTNGSGTLSWVAQSGGGGGGSAITIDTTGTQTLSNGQHGTTFTYTSSGLQTYTVQTSPTNGTTFYFYVSNAGGIKILMPTGKTISLNGITSATAGNVTSTVVGDTIAIILDGSGNAQGVNSSGSWIVT